MKVSLQFLERAAADTGFRAETLEKVVRLGELAGDIGRHPLLREALALKGGTALNLLFGQPRRLSVDLDFNYVGSADRAAMLADRPKVEAAVEELGRRRGYAVQRSRDEHAGRTFFFSFLSSLGTRQRIEVDLNFLFRVPLTGLERREMWQPGGLDHPALLAVGIEELCVGKILALLDRTAARDVYDVANLPKIAGQTLTAPSFRSLFIAMSAILDHPLSSYRESRLSRLTEDAIEQQLLGMLIGADRPTAAELRRQAWAVVGRLLDLTPEEAAYVKGVSRGELLLDPLFPNAPELSRELASHPALEWKVVNVKAHRKRGGRHGGSQPPGGKNQS